VTTESGRSVIVADSETLLIWNGATFEKKKTCDVQVGQEIPITFQLSAPEKIKTHVDMSLWLSKDEWVYGTEFWKAVDAMRNVMASPLTEGAKNWLKHAGKDPTRARTSVPKGWWAKNNKVNFVLPYPRKARLQRVMSGRSNTEVIKEGYIYPYHAQRNEQLFPDKFELNKENGIFVGLFLAEGHVDTTKNSGVRISNNNLAVIEFVQDWFDKHHIGHNYFEKQSVATENRVGGTSITVSGNCAVLAQFLLKWLGHLSYHKYVPHDAFQASDEFVAGVLNGYFSGDGSVTGAAITASSVSKKLIHGIAALCSRLGMVTKISERQLKENNVKTKNIARTYLIRIAGENSVKFADRVGMIDSNKAERLAAVNRHSKSQKYNNFINNVFTDKIVGMKKVEVNEGTKLYDVTVPSTLNFCAFNGIGLRDKLVSLTASCL